MISYGKQTITQSDIDSVVEMLKSDWLTQGPAVELFENNLKTYFEAEHCCAVSNGTAALHLTGLALGWQAGDIVITSPITFLSTVNCIVYAGATPDFVDIDPVSYTIDSNQLEEKVKAYREEGKNVKAIIGVDFAGHPCEWETLREIADKYDLQLVNDNCHALGAAYLGDKQYAVKYADVVIQSYHPVKHITTGEGGAVLTNNLEIDRKVRCLRTHGMTKDLRQIEKNSSPWYYEMHEVGFNYRITDFQCALGSSQLMKLDQFVKKRCEIAIRYNEEFEGNQLLITPNILSTVCHAFHLYPLQVDFQNISLNKIALFREIEKLNIKLQVHYIPVHTQPYYMEKFGFQWGDYPIAEEYYERAISLPIYPSLSTSDIEYIVEKINAFQ